MKLDRQPQISSSSINSLQIKIPDLASDQKKNVVDVKIFSIVLNGESLECKITFSSDIEDYWLCCFEIDVFDKNDVKKEEPMAFASLVVGENSLPDEDGNFLVETYIENKSRKHKGLGRALYERMIKLLPELSNKWGIPLIHTVQQTPHEGLGKQKWEELLLPVLRKYNYSKKELKKSFPVETWERVYLPTK